MQFDLIKEKQGYSAICEKLGINTHADTFEELLLMMDDALQLYRRVQEKKKKLFSEKIDPSFSLLRPGSAMRFSLAI